jgi:hypothetical protein
MTPALRVWDAARFLSQTPHVRRTGLHDLIVALEDNTPAERLLPPELDYECALLVLLHTHVRCSTFPPYDLR